MNITSKRLMALIAAVSAVGFGIGAVVFGLSHLFNYGIGVLIGMAASLLRVVVLERGVLNALEKNPRDADNFMKLNSFARLGIAAAALGLSLWLLKDYGFYGAAVGILSMSVAAYVVGLLPGAKENRELLKRAEATVADNTDHTADVPSDNVNHPESSSGEI